MKTLEARLEALERQHEGPPIIILRGMDGRYSVGNGERLTQEEYDAWALAHNITPDSVHVIRICYDTVGDGKAW